jgi:hypothetical protein
MFVVFISFFSKPKSLWDQTIKRQQITTKADKGTRKSQKYKFK